MCRDAVLKKFIDMISREDCGGGILAALHRLAAGEDLKVPMQALRLSSRIRLK